MSMNRKENEINGKFVIALSRTLRNIHKDSDELFREYNITMSQFSVLEALYHKGTLSVGALIEHVLSTSGNMTVVIRNLEKRLLVERNVSENDRRLYLVTLTQEGEKLIQSVFEQHMALLEKNLFAISDSEKEEVIHIMKKLMK